VPRSRHLWPLIGLGVVVGGVIATVAFAVPWLPQQAAVQARREDALLWFLVAASGAIFTIVVAFLLYSVWRFRVDDDDDADGPPLHGNTPLEIIWTAIPAALLAIVVVYSYLVISRNEALAKDRMNVNVLAQQFAWHFTYPQAGITIGELRLPVGRQVVLSMTAKDVIHAFWVPEFRLQEDAVPGITTTLVITPTRIGSYPVICAELCGIGHTLMRSRAIVMSQPDFTAWLQKARMQVAASAAPPAGAPSAPLSPPAPAGAVAVEADPSQLAFVQKTLQVKAGTVTFRFTNPSPVPHNFAIKGNGVMAGPTTTIHGGASAELTVKLTPGTYEFYCAVPGHEQAGMKGTLTVT
jgi:cytochrome c oxidase subunit 2